jgi:hypothetical protein
LDCFGERDGRRQKQEHVRMVFDTPTLIASNPWLRAMPVIGPKLRLDLFGNPLLMVLRAENEVNAVTRV